jgi:hypothetical protein
MTDRALVSAQVLRAAHVTGVVTIRNRFRPDSGLMFTRGSCLSAQVVMPELRSN